MSGKSINFDDKNINKSSYYKNEELFSLNDIDVNKILVSKKESYGTKSSSKYFIVKHFDSNKTMYFKVSDNKLLKRYNLIWEKN